MGASPTLRSFASEWLDRREAAGDMVTVGRARADFRLHIFPVLGEFELAALTGPLIADWVTELRRRKQHASKTIRSIHSHLVSCLYDAKFRGHIPTNPAARLPAHVLPPNRGRRIPPWTRDQIRVLVTDDRVPKHVQVLTAIGAFTGMRLGEAAGLRWRSIDTAARPLWRIDLQTQYDGRPLKGKSGRPGHARSIPVHRELRRVLERWKSAGWTNIYGRPPTRDDFVVLNTHAQHFGKPLTGDARTTFTRAVAAVGMPREKGQGFHSLRRSFISFARADGARKDVLEKVTHNSAGDIVDGYTYWGWEPLCEAVSALRLDIGAEGEGGGPGPRVAPAPRPCVACAINGRRSLLESAVQQLRDSGHQLESDALAAVLEVSRAG